MKIVHKNSEEEFTEFPAYGEYYYSMYGYLQVTWDKMVLFFFIESEDISYVDLTDKYTIYQ